MGDKNPKAKRKMEMQHQRQNQQKGQAHVQHQQKLQEAFLQKHPHEPNT